jgi:hypothetical protein
MLPRVRIVAVSMERWQVGQARIVAISTDVIELARVLRLEEQPTVATAPTLGFQQPRQAWTDVRVPSLARAPVQPIALLGTAMALDLHMPRDRHLMMGMEGDGVRPRGWGGEGPTGIDPMPGPLDRPSDGLRRVSPMGPAAERDPRQVIQPRLPGLAHAAAVVVCPPPDFGVELTDEVALRQGLRAAHDPSQRRQMRLDIGLGRVDQGLGPQAVARGVSP